MPANETAGLIRKLIPKSAPHFLVLRQILNDLLHDDLLPKASESELHVFKQCHVWRACSLKKDQLLIIQNDYEKKGLRELFPVPSYLASFSKIIDIKTELLARKWAANNAQVILGLASIPKQNDKFEMLCMRFRLAQTKEQHHWLWQALPDPALSIEEIANATDDIRALIKINQSNFESNFPFNAWKRISEIQSDYSTFVETKQKKVVNRETSTETKIPPEKVKRFAMEADEFSSQVDKLISSMDYEIPGVDKREQQDDQQMSFDIDYKNKPPKGTEYDENLQTTSLRMQAGHITRHKFEFPTDPKVLPLFACQQVFAKLWAGLQRGDAIDTCLLMSMLTASKAEAWIDIKSLINKRKIRFDKKSQQYFWCSILDISELKRKDIRNLTKNLNREFELPLPCQAIELLKKTQQITPEILQKRISALQNKLLLSTLSKEKIQFALRQVIKRHTSNQLIADVICDASPSHSPAIYYISLMHEDLNREYAKAVRLLGDHIPKFDPSHLKLNSMLYSFGSQVTPQQRLVKSFFKLFSERVQQQTEPFSQFNTYTLWMWHLILLLTSARPVNHAPGFRHQIDSKAGLIWISDKEGRATSSSGRFVPLCNFLDMAIQDYCAYLEKFYFKYGTENKKISRTIRDSLASNGSFLNLFTSKNECSAITPGLVKTLMTYIFPLPLNWERHFGRDYLSSKLPVYLIDAIFGHEAPDQEAWHPFSSISVNELKSAASAYDQMAQDLKLQRMIVNVC